MPAAQDYQLLQNSLIVAVLLLALGVIGFVSRRNLVAMLLSAGIMLQGVTILLAAFGRFYGERSAEVFGLFVFAVTVLLGGCGAALIVLLSSRDRSLDVALWSRLRDPQYETDIEDANHRHEDAHEPATAAVGDGPRSADALVTEIRAAGTEHE